MNIVETGFNQLLILEPKVLGDARGYFMESYNGKILADRGIHYTFVQDNQSSSRRGVLRGLHFQRPPHAQTKLVRVLSGNVLDVVVDLRKQEPTFGKHFSVELSSENKKQLLVPKGFAHGFIVLSEMAEVFYKCDEYYHPQSDGGIYSFDPALGIKWPIPMDQCTLSDKDKKLPHLSELNFSF